MSFALHQFVHTLTHGDAISGEALSIRRTLRQLGMQSEIFSLHSHEKVRECAIDWREFPARVEEAKNSGLGLAVLNHYSIASPLNQILAQTPCVARALIYHNITPPHWFQAYNARVTKDLVNGRRELPSLLQDYHLLLADSQYNAQELQQMGAAAVSVLPLPIDRAKWQDIASSPGITSVLRHHGGVNVLSVGRLAPNKCFEDVLKIFYFYHHKINEKSKLWIVGSDVDTEIYSFELRSLVSDLLLRDAVHFCGVVSDEDLKALYQGSDVYLSMSEHEGFCVPLIEAMYFNLPVIAFNAGAVAETLGNGGILLGEKRHAEAAELVQLLIADSQLRQRLISAGQEQVKRFGEESFARALSKNLIDPIATIMADLATFPQRRSAASPGS